MILGINLLNVKIDAVTIREINSIVKDIIQSGGKEIIANHNLNSVYLFNKNEDLKAFWEASFLTHIDGMPLIWWGKMLNYPLKVKHRITYIDWIHPLLKLADENHWKIFYLGGKPGVAKRASKILSSKYKSISFLTHSGYFNLDKNSEENKKIIEMINDFRPNILMVGMGMPRQETWIIKNYDEINANVILNSGACFDYIAGEQKTPPRFLGKLGLEWLYRLINEPKRLFKRYLLEPMYLIPLFIKDLRNIKFE